MHTGTIAEDIVFNCVMIECQGQAGTGFFVTHQGRTYLVTAAHVALPEPVIRIVIRADSGFLSSVPVIYAFDGSEPQWRRDEANELDIAVLPFDPILQTMKERKQRPSFNPINLDWPTLSDNWRELDAIEEIVTLGYPYAMRDSTELLPIARTGLTATPASREWCGQPVFLVDTPVLPGSSGSPVFVTNRHWPPAVIFTAHGTLGSPRMVTARDNPFTFAGVLTETLDRKQTCKVVRQRGNRLVPERRLEVEAPIGLQLGKAVRAEKLLALIAALEKPGRDQAT